MTGFPAYIFDLDGTLIDSAPDIAAAVNAGFARNGWPALETGYVRGFIGNGSERLMRGIVADLGIAADDAAIARAHRAYRDAYLAAPADRTRLYPHVREDLIALHAAGRRLGICTNKTHVIARRVLDTLGLAGLFDAVLGADMVPAIKPDPRHLLAVAAAMGVEQGQYAYVGDMTIDHATAVAAGVPFYLVGWAPPEPDLAAVPRLGRLSDLLSARS